MATWAVNKVEPELEKAEPDDVGAGIELMSLSDFPLAVSSYELIQEQQGDPLLKELLDCGLLFRKFLLVRFRWRGC